MGKTNIINYDGNDANVLANLIEQASRRGATVIINAPQFHMHNTNSPMFTNAPQFTDSHQTHAHVDPHIAVVSAPQQNQIAAQAQGAKRGFFVRLFGGSGQPKQINAPTPRRNDIESNEFELSEALNEWYRTMPRRD